MLGQDKNMEKAEKSGPMVQVHVPEDTQGEQLKVRWPIGYGEG